MRDPDEFDAFYLDARQRLLLQTYALTGDLAAAKAAVRDAFVVAWHHWRKAVRSGDPEAWTRPLAWTHAQRRHTARPWHRERPDDPEVAETLDALRRLTLDQRRILLLTMLASGSTAEHAREVGLTPDEAEKQLQVAMSQFAIHRGIESPLVRAAFTPLAAVVADVRLPRATILRRAGAARRRTHTVAGVAASVAALLLTGMVVTDSAGVRPTLDREVLTSSDGSGDPAAEPTPVPQLGEGSLLTAEQVARRVGGRGWRVTATTDNTEGDGRVLPCQQARYADRRGSAALVRTFAARGAGKAPRRTAAQLTEASRTPRAARRTFDTALGWFAGCSDDRAQLQSTRRVSGVGDRAMLLVLRDWDDPVTTIVAGVARTGLLTTATVTTVATDAVPDFRGAAELLGDAVDGLCELPEAGACTGRVRLEVVRPVPTGAVPAMLSEVDLPPVRGVSRPWVGTAPQRARQNYAATRCDNAEFTGQGWTNNLTRTFLVPGARLPAEFGLTQTVGSLPVPRARAFVRTVRDRIASCPDRDLGTEVDAIDDVREGNQDVSIWNVTTEISDTESVRYRMAVLRHGTSVAQVSFVPAGDTTMQDQAFTDLVYRALDRLRELPPPRR